MVRCIGHTIYYSGALYEAMKAGKNETVMTFLQGFEVTEVADYEGVTLLHLAAACGNVNIAKYLIKAGYEIDVVDNCGCTPLLFAVRMNRSKIVQLLINYGANICKANFLNISPLTAAIKNKHNIVNNAIIESLVNALMQLDMDKESIATILIKAEWSLHLAMKLNNMTLTKLMIDKGADINFQDARGKTPLHRAVRYGDYQHVILLLNHGADINVKDFEGGTVLRNAVLCSKHPNILKTLIINGSNIHDIDKTGRMQCQYIFKYGNKEAIEILLNHGADSTMKDCFGDTILHYAACNIDREVMKAVFRTNLLIDAKNVAGQTLLHKAAEIGNLNCSKILLERRADVNCKDSMGRTPLFFAVKNINGAWLEVRSDLIRLLFEYGANICKPIANRHIVKFVIEQGIYPIIFTVVQYVAKLNSLCVSVDEEDMRAIYANTVTREYYKGCHEEISSMKATLIFGRITYYNLLIDEINAMTPYARHENFAESYKMINLLNLFPKYSRTLFNKCSMVFEKHKLIENSAIFLSSILPLTNSHHIAVRKIIDYLNVEDMRRLVA